MRDEPVAVFKGKGVEGVVVFVPVLPAPDLVLDGIEGGLPVHAAEDSLVPDDEDVGEG